MSEITAVVLTATGYTRRFDGIEVLVHQSTITTPYELQRARFSAIKKVDTPFFFYLDDTDELPDGYQSVLERCIAAGAALAYTDEIVRRPGVEDQIRRAIAYSQDEHLRRPMLVHHLALCRTNAAQHAINTLPVGHYSPELLLYWQLAKLSAAHVPEIGYIWNRNGGGMSTWPATVLSWGKALAWCKEHP